MWKFLEPMSIGRSQNKCLNRIALAPMTNKQSHADGRASQDEINWLEARAKGGFGIVITCASHVHLDGQGWQGEMGIFDDTLLDGLTQVATSISKHGSMGIVQLYHGGLRSPRELTGKTPVSASSWPASEQVSDGARELSIDEILEIKESFVAAAKRAHEAGFQGVEIHGAHGYVFTQFLDRKWNKRQDIYGGSLENRSRFLIEVLDAIRSQLPAEFIVGVRVSVESAEGEPVTWSAQETIELSRAMIDKKVDFIHYSLSQFDRRAHTNELEIPLLTQLSQAVKNYSEQVCVMVAGGVVNPGDAEKAIELGADAVALGRIAIANPNWPNHSAEKLDYQPKLWPYSEAELKEAVLGDSFVNYMKRWPGFVRS